MSVRQSHILGLIAHGVSLSRDIALQLGATPQQIHQSLLDLERCGRVKRCGKHINPKGPPSIIWQTSRGYMLREHAANADIAA